MGMRNDLVIDLISVSKHHMLLGWQIVLEIHQIMFDTQCTTYYSVFISTSWIHAIITNIFNNNLSIFKHRVHH